MSRIYLAGASSELAVCKAWMARLRDRGHAISHDWTTVIDAVGDANPRDATREAMRLWATDDCLGVITSEIFWLLVPRARGSVGSWVELGVATGVRAAGRGAPLVVVSGDTKSSIFLSMADHLFEGHETAFDWIVRAAP